MRFIFWWGFFSLILTGGIYFFERKDIIEIFIASLIVSFVFIGLISVLLEAIKRINDLDNKKKLLLSGFLMGVIFGLLIGENNED